MQCQDIFIQNFWKTFKEYLPKGTPIKDFKKCDFSKMTLGRHENQPLPHDFVIALEVCVEANLWSLMGWPRQEYREAERQKRLNRSKEEKAGGPATPPPQGYFCIPSRTSLSSSNLAPSWTNSRPHVQ